MFILVIEHDSVKLDFHDYLNQTGPLPQPGGAFFVEGAGGCWAGGRPTLHVCAHYDASQGPTTYRTSRRATPSSYPKQILHRSSINVYRVITDMRQQFADTCPFIVSRNTGLVESSDRCQQLS